MQPPGRRKVIYATQKQAPRPRSTKICHSLYYERPQARIAAELLGQAHGRISERYAWLL